MNNFFTIYTDQVARTPQFGTAHLIWIASVLATWIAVPLLLRRNKPARELFLRTLAITMLANEVLREIWLAVNGASIASILPFDLCGFMLLLTAFTVFVRKKLLMNICFALGFTAAIFGIFTPSLTNYPPLSYNYINGMFSHCAICLIVIIFIASREFTPEIKYLPAIVGAFCAFALVIIAPLDYLMGANWFYLAYAPKDTPVELFYNMVGWPWYVGLMLLLGIVLWCIFYAPFVIAKAMKRISVDK